MTVLSGSEFVLFINDRVRPWLLHLPLHVVVFLGELSGVVIFKALISPLVFHGNVIDVLELLLVRSIALYSFDWVFLDCRELLKFSLFGLRCL